MAVPATLAKLVGRWRGNNHLWLDPNEPARESEATAVFQPVAQKKFVSLHYTWADEGEPQDGILLLGQDGQQINATWVDSWHMQDKMMQLTGVVQPKPEGAVFVEGSYAAPPDSDWGWRIMIQPTSETQFALLMHNITPEGEAMLAVEAQFSREP